MYKAVLVDDEALIREGVSENIQWDELGYELAACCENGREAAEFIRSHEVDVVLTDICMPFMDGLELSEFLCKEYPQIQIVILSGYDEFDYAVRALKYRVTEYLLKPVTATELSQILTDIRRKLDLQREKMEHIGRMSSTYHRTKLLARSNVLFSLIMGDKSEEESRKEMEETGIVLAAMEYRVAIIEMNMYLDNRHLDERQKQDRALMAFVVYNISHEIVDNYHAGEVCQGKAYRTLILFCINKPNEFRQTIRRILEEITAHLKAIMDLDVTIGVGESASEWKELCRSYEGGEKALSLRYTLGESRGNIIDMEELGRELAGRERRQAPERLDVKELLLGIRSGDKDAIADYLSYVKGKFVENVLGRERICLYFQQMVEEAGKLCAEYGVEEEPALPDKEKTITAMLDACTMEEALAVVEEYLQETARIMDSQKNAGGKKYAVLAMDYIEKCYGRRDMNLNSVCSYLNISASRFSSIFKTVTNETFMEALTRIRMEKARELLKNTDMKNYEIAERVGFGDPHYFSVAFKKATGKSPTEYAREAREEA